MARKILLLTQYYPPETGAPQNRLASLARSLRDLGWQVTVLTAMPNYPRNAIYEGYRGKSVVHEQIDSIPVVRTRIYVSAKRNIPARLLNYFSFVWSSWVQGRKLPAQDIIICESPPLFLGITAVMLKRKFAGRLVFNVSDLWPESAVALNIVTNRFFLYLSYRLEAWIYHQADLVSVQTQGIRHNILNRYPAIPVHWLPNGFDFSTDCTAPDKPQRQNPVPAEPKIILYAGILGHAQGLEVVLQAAGLLRQQADIRFVICGDGPECRNLQNLRDKLGLDNVEFTGHLSRQKVLEYLAACSAAVVPLKKNKLFEGAIPSKLFEALACRKPVLLGVNGEARKLFIDRARAGVYFEPENPQALKEAILKLFTDPQRARQMGDKGYAFVKEHFDRHKLAGRFSARLTHMLDDKDNRS